ncbi:unnamed protein product, partial [Laminaria digitata]
MTCGPCEVGVAGKSSGARSTLCALSLACGKRMKALRRRYFLPPAAVYAADMERMATRNNRTILILAAPVEEVAHGGTAAVVPTSAVEGALTRAIAVVPTSAGEKEALQVAIPGVTEVPSVVVVATP